MVLEMDSCSFAKAQGLYVRRLQPWPFIFAVMHCTWTPGSFIVRLANKFTAVSSSNISPYSLSMFAACSHDQLLALLRDSMMHPALSHGCSPDHVVLVKPATAHAPVRAAAGALDVSQPPASLTVPNQHPGH